MWPQVSLTPEAEFLDVNTQKSSEFSSLLFTVTSNNWFYSLPSLSKSGLKLVCNVNIVHGNLKSQNSQDHVQKLQRNCTFINSASGVNFLSVSKMLVNWWSTVLAPSIEETGGGALWAANIFMNLKKKSKWSWVGRGPGEDDLGKNLKTKISWNYPFQKRLGLRYHRMHIGAELN